MLEEINGRINHLVCCLGSVLTSALGKSFVCTIYSTHEGFSYQMVFNNRNSQEQPWIQPKESRMGGSRKGLWQGCVTHTTLLFGRKDKTPFGNSLNKKIVWWKEMSDLGRSHWIFSLSGSTLTF